MRTPLIAATAAALSALAVTVAGTAFGSGAHRSRLDRPQKVVENAGPDEATLRTCLTDHGATVPSGDGLALKRWIIGDRTSIEKNALKACGFAPPGVAPMTKSGGAPCGPSADRSRAARASRKQAR